MFETIDDPVGTLRVPRWLWNLCVRFYEANDMVLRVAAPGLLVNRAISKDEEVALRDRLEERFDAWANALSEREIDDLERAIDVEICRLRAWLPKLLRDRFPEGELVAFACAREILEAAMCALETLERAEWALEELARLDQDVVRAIDVYAPSPSKERRRIYVKRHNALLEMAHARDEHAWWGRLACPPRKSRKRRP